MRNQDFPFDWSGVMCLAVFIMMACKESIVCMLQASAGVIKRRETPRIIAVPTEMNTRIASKCPSLKEYTAPFWAIGPIAQSVFSKFLSRKDASAAKKYQYERECIELHDGVSVALDWRQTPNMTDDTPIVMLFHGLGGDSTMSNMQTTSLYLLQHGYRVVVYNRRGHGGMSIMSSKGSVSNLTQAFPQHYQLDDAVCAVAHVHKRYPLAPKILVGYSAGANLATHVAAEPDTPFVGFVSASNPYCVLQAAKLIKQNQPMCNLLMATCVKEIIYSQLKELQQLLLPEEVRKLTSCRCLRKLDDTLARYLYGYEGVDEYHQVVSCKDKLKQIKIPMLAIGNDDDLVVDNSLLKYVEDAALENPNIMAVRTQRGGHLGWIQGMSTSPSWLHTVTKEWIDAVLVSSK